MLHLRIHLALVCALAWMSPIGASVVITEIMYHPGSDFEEEEFIEILNTGSTTQSLDGWRFSNGVNFSFPPGEELEPGKRLVICLDTDAFDAVHPGVRRVGNWIGHLSNSGERVQLSSPGDLDKFGTRQYIREDRVVYSDGSHPEDCPGNVDLWPTTADGYGMSLNRIDPHRYGNDPNNWQATPPSPGQ